MELYLKIIERHRILSGKLILRSKLLECHYERLILNFMPPDEFRLTVCIWLNCHFMLGCVFLLSSRVVGAQIGIDKLAKFLRIKRKNQIWNGPNIQNIWEEDKISAAFFKTCVELKCRLVINDHCKSKSNWNASVLLGIPIENWRNKKKGKRRWWNINRFFIRINSQW